MKTKILFSALLTLGLNAQAATPAVTSDKNVTTTNDIILQAWCWSFNTIRENLPDIAKAGYTIVQTPPAQNCIHEAKGDKGGGPQLFGHGRWYYHYQPTDWKIGNYQVGTADELSQLCDEARKYGIRIIVDVLPNHTAIDDTRVSDDLDVAVGGHENLYHATGFDEIRDYNDRLQCTTGQMGGLPDVNTENPDFQYYYMGYVNELIRRGVRGFRYDTAKHIGLPSDPKDSRSAENDFWLVATGRKPVRDRSLLYADSLYIYGEVLQDKNVKETEYAEYMSLTASGLGWVLRHELEAGQWKADEFSSFCHPVAPEKLITWVESHDTYCNDHESGNLTDQQIALGWVFLTARQQGAPLFFPRPAGSDAPSGNYWGNNIVGARGNDNFMSPLVAAANQFRHKMQGQPEQLALANGNTLCQVDRGNKGSVVINLSAEAQTLSLPTSLANGSYTDAVTGAKYKVRKGLLTGTIPAQSAIILTKK